VVVLFGCLLALLGWIGLNSAGAILFSGVPATGAVLIAINTLLSAAAAGLTAAIVTRMRFRKPDASLAANGWVGGLVASSAGCAFVAPAAAILIGIVAGALVPLTVELLELRLSVDDPGGVIPVHGVAGIWGILAVGAFAHLSGGSLIDRPGQFLAQLIGVATLLGFVLPMTYGLNWLLNRFYPQRVVLEGEHKGMDLHELGAGAYPDFVTHTDEHTPR
jgi:Amt family ammonium transporter